MSTTPSAPDDQGQEARNAGKRILGLVLMAGGGMVALLCGLCTLGFGYLMVAQSNGPEMDGLIIPLIIGGVPTGIGILVFWIGLSVYRDGSARRGQPWREFE